MYKYIVILPCNIVFSNTSLLWTPLGFGTGKSTECPDKRGSTVLTVESCSNCTHLCNYSVITRCNVFYYRLLEDIIKEYFCLLEAGYSYGTNSITCVHYLGLIDCSAVWFHKWMVII